MGVPDVPAAAAVWTAASDDYRRRQHLPDIASAGPADEERDRLQQRISRLRRTDPDGAWVAVDEQAQVIGLAQAFVRDGYWVLSLLGVLPDHQSSGVGHALLQRTLAYEPRARGTIQASRDPRAVRLYSGAGFDTHPVVVAWGELRPDVHGGVPASVRPGSVDDMDLVSDIDRAVRGATRPEDVEHLLRVDGCSLLLDGRDAYALTKPNRVVMAAGRDDAAATRVLRAAFASAPRGGRFEVGWLTAAQQWAIRAALAAGLELVPHGPVMTRGMDGPPHPAIPSGGYG